MPQKIAVGDKISDKVNNVATQVVSAVSRAIVNYKSIATITIPSKVIVVDEDVLIISHTAVPQSATVAGQTTYIVGQ